ncbi:MAG: hypothetical protein QXU40_01885 [Candidatus Pacearchaeota archaeon]
MNNEIEEEINKISESIEDLKFEATKVYENLVKPNWWNYEKRFYRTLYGYILNCFSFIDLLSGFLYGTQDWKSLRINETKALSNFIHKYLKWDEKTSLVAVNLFRHCIIHKANIYPHLDINGIKYRWLLHWSDKELPRSQHAQFQSSANEKILNLNLFCFIDDILKGLREYKDDLKHDSTLRNKFNSFKNEIDSLKLNHDYLFHN